MKAQFMVALARQQEHSAFDEQRVSEHYVEELIHERQLHAQAREHDRQEMEQYMASHRRSRREGQSEQRRDGDPRNAHDQRQRSRDLVPPQSDSAVYYQMNSPSPGRASDCSIEGSHLVTNQVPRPLMMGKA